MSGSSKEIADKVFRPSDVKKASGLSYRQLNDWENRGVLPDAKDRGVGWRGYSSNELFIIAILAELRSFYGIPVEKFKFLKTQLTKDEFDYFEYVWFKFNYLGTSLWLFTDFEGTVNFMSQFEISNYFENTPSRKPDNLGFAIFDITKVLARVKATVEQSPIQVDMHGKGFKIRQEGIENNIARNADEASLLQFIRDQSVSSFEVIMNDGRVKTVRVTKKKSVDSTLRDILAENDFQEIIIRERHGKIVDLSQRETLKYSHNE